MNCLKNTSGCDELVQYCKKLCNASCECYNDCIENFSNEHLYCIDDSNFYIILYCSTLLLFLIVFGILKAIAIKCKLRAFDFIISSIMSFLCLLVFLIVLGWNIYPLYMCCQQTWYSPIKVYAYFINYFYGPQDPTQIAPLLSFPNNFLKDIIPSTECPVCFNKDTLCILACRHVICKQCLSGLYVKVCVECRRNIDFTLVREI